MMPKLVVLQGDPGVGKSMMACLTAVHQPVHVIDVDRKVESAGWAQDAIASGKLTVWEVSEPMDESNIASRVKSLVAKEPPALRPKGFELFSELAYKLPTTEPAKLAGTWVVDSLTLLNDHYKSLIAYHAKQGKFGFDQWSALKSGWTGTMSFLKDQAKEHGKDLIVTVHERLKLEPGEKTRGAEMQVHVSKVTGEASQTHVFSGTQDIEIWASIDGAYGGLLGAQTDEYYHLYVDATDKDHPKWLCRVWPDGRRALRTSFKLDRAVHEPDFRKIWR